MKNSSSRSDVAPTVGGLAVVRRASRRGRGLLLWSGLAVAAAVVTAALASSSGTLALWNDAADIPTASITVGAGVDLAIAAGTSPAAEGQLTAALPENTWSAMLPGETVGTEFTVTNFGSRTANLQAALDTQEPVISDIDFRLSFGVCSSAEPESMRLSYAPLPPPFSLLAPGESVTFCLSVIVSPNIAADRAGQQLVPSFAFHIADQQEEM